MSEGPRIALAQAQHAAADLCRRWSLPQDSIVGSVRRRRGWVGDLDLVAPLPEQWEDRKIQPRQDPLFGLIDASVENPWGQPEGGMFAPPPKEATIGRAVSGLKPGFVLCSLLLRCYGIDLPVQIHRFTPANRGWLLIEKTGPVDFGRYFLGKWKEAHDIPVGKDEHRASIDNHLVDRWKQVVPVETEQKAFELAGLKFIRPEVREEIVTRMRAVSGRPERSQS